MEKKCPTCNVVKALSEFSGDHCKPCKKAYNKLYWEKNKDKYKDRNRKEYFKTYFDNRRATDVTYNVVMALRHRLYAMVSRKGYKKTDTTILLLGCSIDELLIYLESKFSPTMCWDNYGSLWHIDHIIPCSTFDLTNEEEQRICFHYTNLQPLFAKTTTIDNVTYVGNLNKGAKVA